MTTFSDRTEAGRLLGQALRDGPLTGEQRPVVVLAIPRGGVPVAAQVATALDADLDVVVVRKLRVPSQPELGFGAVGPDGAAEIDEALVRRLDLSREEVAGEIEDRRAAVEHRLAEYRAILPAPTLEGAVAVVVDDGVATGGTARQACLLARRQGAARVVLGIPVGPARVEQAMEGAADDVVVLSTPDPFMAVGQAYDDFTQLDDADVRRELERAASARAAGDRRGAGGAT